MRDAIQSQPKADGFVKVVRVEYGCVRCQKCHREGDPLFAPHVVFQAKHSYREVDVYQAIVEAKAAAE